ncbi:MAG: CpsD/CapB family tyrosine-protein kinase [Pyrinomonadaceae bacterium]
MSRVYEALKRAAAKEHRAGGTTTAGGPPDEGPAQQQAAAPPEPPTPSAGDAKKRAGRVTTSLRKAVPAAAVHAPESNGHHAPTTEPAAGNGHYGTEIPEVLLRDSPVFRGTEPTNVPVVLDPVAGDETEADEQQSVPDFSNSAFTEHTDVAAGSALSGVTASRAAGATVSAVSSARAATGYASLEVDPARVEPHLVALLAPRSSPAERYRSLRTRVLHASERRRLQAIVITSAGVMEGKTLTALNLSWLMAQTDGVRALLIDGDLRHPCAGEYLGLDLPVGLSEILAGEAELDDTIVRLNPAGLFLLPGGQTRDDVAELLSGPKFSALLAELRRSFDYIIIDAPPLGIFTDATLLTAHADSAIIVVRSGHTRFATLDRVLEPIPRESILGVVLNDADEMPSESNYYYQRRYSRRDAQDAQQSPESAAAPVRATSEEGE